MATTEKTRELGGVARVGARQGLIHVTLGPFDANAVDTHGWIAKTACRLIQVKEIHTVAGTDGSAVTANVSRCQGTEAPASGDTLQTGSFNLKAAANTVQTGVLAAALSSSALDFAAGDRLSVNFGGTLTSLAGCIFDCILMPIPDTLHQLSP